MTQFSRVRVCVGQKYPLVFKRKCDLGGADIAF